MKKFEAIIWDCDGVLMDSEFIACKAEAEILTEFGFPTTTEEALNNYMGKTMNDVLTELGIKEKYSEISEEINKKTKDIFEKELKIIDGISEVLKEINLPMCIASGSSMERLNYSLKLVGLYDFFKGKIFSAELVENGKPAPDIFLYSAKKLNVDPKKCLVIEDGNHGTTAGVKAGMTVYGFTGASHMTEKRIKMLEDAGTTLLFDKMSKLTELIKK